MKKIKLLSLVTVAVLGASALVACGPQGGEEELTTVRIGLHENFGAGAGYSAINQGFFEEEGIKAEPILGGGPQLAASVVEGTIDVSFMGNGVAWNYFGENEEIKLIALDNLTDDDRLIASKAGKGKDLTINSTLTEIATALKGSKLAFDATKTPAAFWSSLVAAMNGELVEGQKVWYEGQNGEKLPTGLTDADYVAANQVTVINTSDANLTTSMQSGEYDFCISFSPVATTLEKDTEHFTVVAKTSTHLEADSYTPSTWAVNAKWLASNEETFKKFMRGLVKGMNFRNANPEECTKDVEAVSAGKVLASSLDTTIAQWLNAEQQLEIINNGDALKYVENIRNSQLAGDNAGKVSDKVTAEKAADFSYLKEACEALK